MRTCAVSGDQSTISNGAFPLPGAQPKRKFYWSASESLKLLCSQNFATECDYSVSKRSRLLVFSRGRFRFLAICKFLTPQMVARARSISFSSSSIAVRQDSRTVPSLLGSMACWQGISFAILRSLSSACSTNPACNGSEGENLGNGILR
jgi:hypothetical protein